SRWVSVANTNATNLTPGTGYRMIFRGNRTQGCSLLDGSNTTAQATTLSAKGVLAQGDVSVTLQPGFNLLGNPYASPLNFATVQSDNTTNIENNYWAYFAPANAATPNYSVYSA
ncbi:MAG TPA: hypothetical protein DCL43_01800, partial [Chitinophagaceae bacterium]|nr:hypothetical protein [Chitinophagaceae bacterium]